MLHQRLKYHRGRSSAADRSPLPHHNLCQISDRTPELAEPICCYPIDFPHQLLL
ncbi:hypothetical protein [Microcoleus sp. S11D4]|uniref:hypothetical protein n=1 Tax=Microcoleus sp. S11D4 TaxID=3055407 RepID=UPI002FD6B800